jgi:hypothetical protein
LSDDYISQLIRYARACFARENFSTGDQLLTKKIIVVAAAAAVVLVVVSGLQQVSFKTVISRILCSL